MKGKILYTWISTWFCTLTAKFIVIQYHIHLTDVDLKRGLQPVSINLLRCFVMVFLEFGFGEGGDKIVLLSLLNFYMNFQIWCSIGKMLKLEIDLWNFCCCRNQKTVIFKVSECVVHIHLLSKVSELVVHIHLLFKHLLFWIKFLQSPPLWAGHVEFLGTTSLVLRRSCSYYQVNWSINVN